MGKRWLRFYDTGVPEEIELVDDLRNVYQILENACALYPKNTALIFFDRKITYIELLGKVHHFAAALQGLGVKRGDRVAIMLPNSPELVVAYFAVLASGATVVMTNPLYTIGELKNQMDDSGAKILITLDLFWPKAEEVRNQTSLEKVILTTLGGYLGGIKRLVYLLMRRFKGKVNFKHGQPAYFFDQLLKEYASSNITLIKDANDDIAAIQYTGGTTGLPKGAMLTHRNLLANAVQLTNWFPELEAGKERMLAVLPFFHVFGLSVCLNMTILACGTLILIPKFSGKTVKELLEVIEKYRPTLFPAVPPIYMAISNFKEIYRYDLSSIKYCVSGAAPLPKEIQEDFEELTGAVLVEGYGLTEASPVTHCNPLNKKTARIGSIGLPLPSTMAKVVNSETGEELPVGEVGELVIRGPQVMRGYWKNDEETKQVLRNGWLYTGDLAKTDEGGYFSIADRKKDLIIVGGYNVYPREVEEVLYAHPKVADAAVIGVPHQYKGEQVKAYIVLRKGEETRAEEIKDYCRKHLAPYKVPKIIEFRDELPKSIIGKVLKKDLRE